MGYTTVSSATITVTCETPSCPVSKTFSVNIEQVRAWEGGTPIQEAMPDVPADIREIMISGMCGTCYDKLFENIENEMKGMDPNGNNWKSI